MTKFRIFCATKYGIAEIVAIRLAEMWTKCFFLVSETFTVQRYVTIARIRIVHSIVYMSESLDDGIRETQWKKKNVWWTVNNWRTTVVIEHVILLFIIQLLSICMWSAEVYGREHQQQNELNVIEIASWNLLAFIVAFYRKTQLTWSVSDRTEKKKKGERIQWRNISIH